MAENSTRIIRNKHLPLIAPFNIGLLWWIALEHFHSPTWLWGVLGTIFVLYTIAWLTQLFTKNWISV